MPLGKDFVFVQVRRPWRHRLKKLAVNQEKPMHQLLEELIDLATQAEPGFRQEENTPVEIANGQHTGRA